MEKITILAIGVLINSLTILWLIHSWNKRFQGIWKMFEIQGEFNELIIEENEQRETRSNHAETNNCKD